MNKTKSGFIIFAVLVLLQWSCMDQNNNDNDNVNAKQKTQKSELEVLNEKIQKDSTNAMHYNNRAKEYLKENKTNKALSDINKALQLDGSNSDFFITLSDIYLMMGEAGKCHNALNKAVSLDPENINAILKSAELNFLLKNYNKTFELVNDALKLDDYNPTAYYIKAYTFLEQKDTVNAIKNFQIAVNQNQEFYKGYLQLGVLFLEKNDVRAVGYYQNALKVFPESIEALYGIAMYYQNNSGYQKALDHYNKILALDSENLYAYYNSGYIFLVYLKEFEKAIKYFSDAIEISPEYFKSYYNRGYSYELSGDYENAKSDYNSTLDLKTNYKKAIEGLNRLDRQ